MEAESKLRIVKVVHTVVWAVFASSIVAIPLFTFAGHVDVAAGLIAFVMLEVLVLAFNQMRCPLTDVASRYTSDRRDDFDIYLPLWLARENKRIFGTLYVASIAYTVAVWLARG